MALSSYSTMVTDTGGEKPRNSPSTPARNKTFMDLDSQMQQNAYEATAAGHNPNPDDGNGGGGYGGYGGNSGGVAAPAYTAPTLPSATSQEEYIRAMYAANQAQQEAALRTAYDANVGTLDQQAAQLPTTYDAAANQAAAQAAMNRRNFNESAAASGMNTGAGSQAALAQNNALQWNITSVRQKQADALANVDAQRAQLSTEYKNAIADAVQKNNLQLAQALYDEAKRVDESIVSTAVNQANLDFSAWRANY